MPGLMPGVGHPIGGEVLDARTRLPVGGATVVSGLGSTVTDASGRFKLYGNLSSRELSVARAGYTSITVGGEPFDPSREITLTIDQQFPQNGTPKNRVIDLRGQVQAPAGQNALVFLGSKAAPVSNGQFAVQLESPVPGKILTSVLAWGTIQGTYQADAAFDQHFSFTAFSYDILSWSLGNTYPEGMRRIDTPLLVRQHVPLKPVQVNYTNRGAFSSVKTAIALDFGVAGSVPVALASASNQRIEVPAIPGLKYVVQGQAFDDSKRMSSTVSITTNDLTKATFQLLSPPKVKTPASGAAEVGQRPTFSWEPVGQKGILYQLSLYECDPATDVCDPRPKWVCRTTDTEVTYPGFALSDVNGGALRPDKKYTWSIRAVDLLDATEAPTSRRDVSTVKPYLVRKRESEAGGNSFTP
ncbi:MAG: hypothetical protein ACLGIN_04325 [Candidatus Sericytochromatia bacterium]